MRTRISALLASGAIAAVVTFVGAVYFFEPIAATGGAVEAPVPAPLGFLIYIVLSVLLLDWVSGIVGRPIKAALIISASQIILVSVDFVLRGERGATTGAASAVLIFATWSAMAVVYARLAPTRRSQDPAVEIAYGKNLMP